jgi:hypothetical protein
MSTQVYSQCNGTLKVQERSVVGTPVDFYVFAAGKFSDWIKGAPQLHQRLTRAFHARNREAFDALVDQLMQEHPHGA